MRNLSISTFIVCFAVLVTGSVWALDDPTTEPYQDLEAAGIVATDAIYPFASLAAIGVNTGTRHNTVGALPNGNFVLITNTGGSNMAAVVLSPQGDIVAGPAPVAHDANGPIGWLEEGVSTDTGDPWLGISRDGSQVAIVMDTTGFDWEGYHFNNAIYPNDPGSVYMQILNTSDLSPVGTAVSVFPGSVTAPTVDETNFGYFPVGQMPNGNWIILARSRDQWSSELRNQDLDAQGRPNQTQRVGVMTIVNSNLTAAVVAPKFFGRQYGHVLEENPNQWNAEPSRGVVPYADGCVVTYAGPHGWATVDGQGNASAWHLFKGVDASGNDVQFWGDGNQGGLLTNGMYLTGKSEGSQYAVYDARTGERIRAVSMTNWEFASPQRSFAGMNPQGQVFQIWQEHGLYGINKKIPVGRFADADGNVYGDAPFVLMESGTEEGGMNENERGQCAFGNAAAIYANQDGLRPDKPADMATECVVRIFANPFGPPAGVDDGWELY
ncbi:MAG: hypothetical protein ABIH23_03510 [bacterium]